MPVWARPVLVQDAVALVLLRVMNDISFIATPNSYGT